MKKIEKTLFGTTPDGQEVHEYLIKNNQNTEMRVLSLGGIIRTLSLPDKKGELRDIVLGYDALAPYLENRFYFGAIIGRYGNRLDKGKFELNGKEYSLAINNAGNHLHGGLKGFDKVIWEVETFENASETGLILNYLSADGEEGYPGNLNVKVTYTLTDTNKLIFDYEASTDASTVINLTNHAYYNLKGSGNILDHKMQLFADEYFPMEASFLPTQRTPVAGSPFDFRESKTIGRDINANHEQLSVGKGYDHCYILPDTPVVLKKAASVLEEESGIKMEVYTTEPGMQFYTGNYLDNTFPGKGGQQIEQRSGFCLETQHFPNSPNRPDFPATTLNPGEVFRSRTETIFSIQENQ